MLSGSGQASPAPSARFNVSRTVERAVPSRRAISCVNTPENFSRIISRASRIPIRSAGIDPPLGLPKGRPDQANGGARQSVNDPGGIIPLRGATSSRNWGAASSGISTSKVVAQPTAQQDASEASFASPSRAACAAGSAEYSRTFMLIAAPKAASTFDAPSDVLAIAQSLARNSARTESVRSRTYQSSHVIDGRPPLAHS